MSESLDVPDFDPGWWSRILSPWLAQLINQPRLSLAPGLSQPGGISTLAQWQEPSALSTLTRPELGILSPEITRFLRELSLWMPIALAPSRALGSTFWSLPAPTFDFRSDRKARRRRVPVEASAGQPEENESAEELLAELEPTAEEQDYPWGWEELLARPSQAGIESANLSGALAPVTELSSLATLLSTGLDREPQAAPSRLPIAAPSMETLAPAGRLGRILSWYGTTSQPASGSALPKIPETAPFTFVQDIRQTARGSLTRAASNVAHDLPSGYREQNTQIESLTGAPAVPNTVHRGLPVASENTLLAVAGEQTLEPILNKGLSLLHEPKEWLATNAEENTNPASASVGNEHSADESLSTGPLEYAAPRAPIVIRNQESGHGEARADSSAMPASLNTSLQREGFRLPEQVREASSSATQALPVLDWVRPSDQSSFADVHTPVSTLSSLFTTPAVRALVNSSSTEPAPQPVLPTFEARRERVLPSVRNFAGSSLATARIETLNPFAHGISALDQAILPTTPPAPPAAPLSAKSLEPSAPAAPEMVLRQLNKAVQPAGEPEHTTARPTPREETAFATLENLIAGAGSETVSGHAAAAEAHPMSHASVSPHTAPNAPMPAPASLEPDLDTLAHKVYALLKDQLRAERERHTLYSR